ncbi:hypothetical protein C0Q70_06126 [Pomacea canaliculata]|uniref:Uncharacterized protein n=1 Tax=Pomacea canaliculata TaxID=400727 RepID=A0A2T7PNB8_POMCA|nr:uncharacterized protein LOC112560828 [Pomacea canaliculata]PVD34847.1 hypothetical protein C0Q70_06126 [Pomacea canaliculata]
MKWAVAVSLMALVASVLGQTDEPFPCCISRQFEAVLVQFGGTAVGGRGQLIENYYMIFFDHDAKILRVNSLLTGATPDATTAGYIIDDYKSGKRYMVDSNNTCYVSPVATAMPEPCVPSNATYIGKGVLGYGSDSLRVNSWQYIETSTGLSARAAITDDCVPVLQIVTGDIGGAPTELTNIFSNFKPSITSRSVFTLPAADTCKPLPTGSPAVPVGRRSLLF